MRTTIKKALGAAVLSGSLAAATAGLTASGAEAARVQWSASRCARVEQAAFDSLRMARTSTSQRERAVWLDTAWRALNNLAAHC